MNRNISSDLVSPKIKIQPISGGMYSIVESNNPSYPKDLLINEETLRSLQSKGVTCLLKEVADPSAKSSLLFG